MDMQTFADWGVDYLKLDGCNSDPAAYGDGEISKTYISCSRACYKDSSNSINLCVFENYLIVCMRLSGKYVRYFRWKQRIAVIEL